MVQEIDIIDETTFKEAVKIQKELTEKASEELGFSSKLRFVGFKFFFLDEENDILQDYEASTIDLDEYGE